MVEISTIPHEEHGWEKSHMHIKRDVQCGLH